MATKKQGNQKLNVQNDAATHLQTEHAFITSSVHAVRLIYLLVVLKI